MICPSCGRENNNDAPFCANCGTSLSAVPAASNQLPGQSPDQLPAQLPAQSADQPVAQPQAQPQQQPAAQQPQPQQQSTAQQPQPQQQPAAQQQPPHQPPIQPPAQPFQQPPVQPVCPPTVYAQSCIGAAWSDIVHSPGWFGRILLLGLIMCVPVLNFFVIGYAMRWAKQLFCGQVEQLPQKIFAEGNFTLGCFGFVVTLVYGLVGAAVSGIVGWIPILGIVVFTAVSIFLNMLLALALMRVAISNRIGTAFDLKEIWATLKSKPGELFVVSFIPSLIIGAIASVIIVVLSLIFLLPALISFIEVYQYAYSSYEITNAVISLIGVSIPLFILIWLITCLFGAFEYVWSYRAAGHFVARYANGWRCNPTFMPPINPPFNPTNIPPTNPPVNPPTNPPTNSTFGNPGI